MVPAVAMHLGFEAFTERIHESNSCALEPGPDMHVRLVAIEGGSGMRRRQNHLER